MKELSVEEKAKRYDKAIDKITAVVEAGTVEQGLAEWMFPELKESEDEEVEKAIFAMVFDSDDELWNSYDVSKSDVLAWLEKQSEQKPVDTNLAFKIGDVITDGTSTFKIINIKGEFYIAEDGDHVSFYVAHRYYTTVEHFDSLNRINHLEPLESEKEHVCSKEDKVIRNRIIGYLKQDIEEHSERKERINEMIAYLEKQGEQKPTERVEINKSLSDAVITELSKYNGENYWKSPWAIDSTGLQYPLYFANLGATWQKEQMMKDVINAKIGSFTNGTIYDVDFNINSNLKDDDKVKIIVIKED